MVNKFIFYFKYNDYESIGDSFLGLDYNQTNTGSYDLDDYTEPGVYYFTATSGTLSNAPDSSTNGWLCVFKTLLNETTNGCGIKQIFYRQGTIDTNNYRTYIRNRESSGTWSSWYKQLTTAELNGGYNLTQTSFYAPISLGESGQRLVSDGSNYPKWRWNRYTVWEGSKSSGTCTFSFSSDETDIREYNWILFGNSTDAIYAVSHLTPNMQEVRAGGLTATSAGNIGLFGVNGTINSSGTSFTISYCGYITATSGSTNGTFASRTITAIYAYR